jgi:hypothetical protein
MPWLNLPRILRSGSESSPESAEQGSFRYEIGENVTYDVSSWAKIDWRSEHGSTNTYGYHGCDHSGAAISGSGDESSIAGLARKQSDW